MPLAHGPARIRGAERSPGKKVRTRLPGANSHVPPAREGGAPQVVRGERVMDAFLMWNRAVPAAALLALGRAAPAFADRNHPNCPVETVFYDPGNGQDIAVPRGFKVSVFAKDLNFPTGIAFVGTKNDFQVLIIEPAKGLPAGNNCNNTDAPAVGGSFSATNPFTPALPVFDKNGRCLQA